MLPQQYPAVEIPKPKSSDSLDALGGSIVGELLTVALWVSLISLVLAFIFVVAMRNAEKRKAFAIWLVVSFLAFVVLQGLDWIVPALGDVMLSPFEVLK
jgi:hypothetical protein